MDKKKRIRLAVIFLLGSLIVVIGANYGFRIKEDNLTELIVAVIITSSTFYSIIMSNKTNKKIDGIEMEVAGINKKVDVIDEVIGNIDEKQIAMERGFFEISELIRHKDEIINLSKEIQARTGDTLEDHFDINPYLKDLVVRVNEGISMVVRNQYEYGFNEFKTSYFKRQLLNNVNQIAEHIDYEAISKKTFDKMWESFKKNINAYITEVELIKNLENGVRRKHFKEYTFRLTKRITNQTINIWNKYEQKTA